MSMHAPAPGITPAGEGEAAPVRAAGQSLGSARIVEAALALVAACLEAGLAYGAYRHQLPLAWILLCHFFILAALGLWVLWRWRQGRDIAYGLLTMVATAATGPLGALGGALAAVGSRRAETPSPLLDEWYERISHSVEVDDDTKQCDMVSIGRAVDLAADIPSSFSTIMDQGTLAQKQSALGLIARKFHPDYLPALQDALKSEQPVIRVQGAAVAAHIRGDLKSYLQDLIVKAGGRRLDPRAALQIAGRIEHCLASSLIDEQDRAEARIAADRLYERSIGALEFKLPAGRSASFDEQRESETIAKAFENLLLRRGRFADFRALRNAGPRAKGTVR